jgi:protein SCO1
MVEKTMSENEKSTRAVPKAALLLSLAAVALGSVVAFGLLRKSEAEKIATLPGNCNSRAFAEIGGPFNLVNQDNVAVTEKTFLGKPALIYFGFTYCPDICPLSLQSMTMALDEARAAGGKNIDDIQPILISIDPERDTPQSLKTYVASSGFPARLVGLTGSVDQVSAAAKGFKVGYTKSVPKGSSAKDYVVDHTSITYLIGRDGKLRTFFSNDPDPKEVGQCIAALSKAGL